MEDHAAGVAARRVFDRCAELGFALSGVASAETIEHHRELIAWLEAGRHGQMEYLESHLAQRIDPRKKLLGAQSVICVADRYAASEPEMQAPRGRTGRIARYARGDDYHRVMKRRLHELCDALACEFNGHEFVACVDTAPVLEREHARRAGLGYVGKNTMLIEPGVGSYLLLGEIITTLPLETNSQPYDDHCGSCTRCLDACPTGALTPWSLDATECISYHTIELRGLIDERWHAGIGDWIFGCDVCQEVCPHNGDTPRTLAAPVHEAYRPRRGGFDLLEILNWSQDDRLAAFTRSAMKRAKLWMMKRNALIAAGNYLVRRRDPDLLNRIAQLAADAAEHEVVRETARQVLQKLKSSSREEHDDAPRSG